MNNKHLNLTPINKVWKKIQWIYRTWLNDQNCNWIICFALWLLVRVVLPEHNEESRKTVKATGKGRWTTGQWTIGHDTCWARIWWEMEINTKGQLSKRGFHAEKRRTMTIIGDIQLHEKQIQAHCTTEWGTIMEHKRWCQMYIVEAKTTPMKKRKHTRWCPTTREAKRAVDASSEARSLPRRRWPGGG